MMNFTRLIVLLQSKTVAYQNIHGFLCVSHKDSAKGRATTPYCKPSQKKSYQPQLGLAWCDQAIQKINNQGNKLDDDHMHSASQLLQGQFQNLQGLSSPVVGQKFSFERFDWIMGHILPNSAIKAVSDYECYVSYLSLHIMYWSKLPHQIITD